MLSKFGDRPLDVCPLLPSANGAGGMPPPSLNRYNGDLIEAHWLAQTVLGLWCVDGNLPIQSQSDVAVGQKVTS